MSDGVWVVRTEPGCHSKSLLAKICDLPEIPYDFASIMCSQESLCTFIMKYTKDYGQKHNAWPSHHELAKEILLFLAKESGNRGSKRKKKQQTQRRIDLTL